MRLFVALSLAVFTVFVSASPVSSPPVFTIPLTRVKRAGAYLKGSPDADRARAALLRSRTVGGPTNVPATDLAYVQYTTSVGIGNPPTYYNLLVDTGSSNTFCGTRTPYVRTNTSIFTGQNVSATYRVGNFSGLEYLDQVTLAPNLVITNQSIGDALSSVGFEAVDGILGIGPVVLTLGTLTPDAGAAIPTVMNNLVRQGLIKHQVLGVYFAPPSNYHDTNGVLTYGGADPTLYKGEVTYTPVTKTMPSAYYWGINITSATYGPHVVMLNSNSGIVDIGATQIFLVDEFFDVYLAAIPGAKLDSDTGLIEIPPTSIPLMQPLNFSIGGRNFSMDVASQLIPTYQNKAWGGVAGKQYGVVTHISSSSGLDGINFILGQAFVERFYVVFDTDSNRVGFAETNNTFSTVEA